MLKKLWCGWVVESGPLPPFLAWATHHPPQKVVVWVGGGIEASSSISSLGHPPPTAKSCGVGGWWNRGL